MIHVPKGIDVDKTRSLKNYLSLLAFLDKWCNFKWSVFNGCHNQAILSFGMNNVAILNIYGAGYGCIIFAVSKSETVVSLNDADFLKT